MTEIIKAKNKAMKTIVAELKRRDFCTFDFDEIESESGHFIELEARDSFKGQVIRIARISFSEKGRAITDLVIEDI